MKYRLYVDEVGNPDLRASRDPKHRYLSLTGVIMELDYVRRTVAPSIEGLKEVYFDSHPDDPVILHRKELINKKFPFHNLRDVNVEKAFNKDLLSLIGGLEYVVITVVIDKLEHLQRYTIWHFDPYHYCLSVLVERYVLWLQSKGSVGDVLAESRKGKEDLRLKDSFRRFYLHGTDFLKADTFAKYLTSKELKVKPKSKNIIGLQLADMMAHPSFRAVLARENNKPLAKNFGGEIASILERSKYHRSPQGRIEGWGVKWLP